MDAVSTEQPKPAGEQAPINKEVVALIQAMHDSSFTPKFSHEDILAGISPQAANERDALAIEQARKLSSSWVEPPLGYTRLYAPKRMSTVQGENPPGRWFTNYEWRARRGMEVVAPKSAGGGKLFYVDVPTDKILGWLSTREGTSGEEKMGNLSVKQIIVPQEIANQAKQLPEPVVQVATTTVASVPEANIQR